MYRIYLLDVKGVQLDDVRRVIAACKKIEDTNTPVRVKAVDKKGTIEISTNDLELNSLMMSVLMDKHYNIDFW